MRKLKIFLCICITFVLSIQMIAFIATANNVELAPIADAYIDFNEPDINTGASYYLYVYHTIYGASPAYYYGEKTYLKFDLSSIPESVRINSAELKLYLLNNISKTSSIGVHYCSNINWNEVTITWNNTPSFESSAIDVRNGIAFEGWYSWDVKSAVQIGISNKKLTLVLNNENANDKCNFASKDTDKVNLKPKLIISYTPNSPPTVGFSYSLLNHPINDTIQFTDTSSDLDGSMVSRLWNFGDGIKSTTHNPQHKYSANGVYTVTLEVTDNDGAKTSASKTITIIINNPPNPPLKPIGEIHVKCGVNYTFNSSAIDPDGDQVRLQFDWGDENFSNWSEFVDSNTSVSSSHAWSTPSNYSIRVIAQDKNGSNSSWSTPLTVTASELNNNIPPIIEIEAVDNASVNQTIIFDASDSIDPDGKIISYNWDFGDGTTSTRKNPTHKYANPGIYLVSLQITDNNGTTNSKTLSVTVAATAVTVNEPKTPGFEFIVAIGAIALVFLWKRKRRYCD